MKARHVRGVLGVVLGAVAASGCLADGSWEEDVELRTGAIQGGQLEAAYPGVGMLFFHDPSDNKDKICTASLVSQSYVLTAKHCWGTNMVFKRGTKWTNFVDHAIDQQIKHPLTDAALLHLTTPVEGVPVLKVNEGARPAVDTICTAVGFGDYRDPVTLETTNTTKRSCTEKITFSGPNDIVVTKESGISDGGDSGGPLLCGGFIAATDSNHTDGAWPQHKSSNYVTVDAPWIASVIAPVYTELSLQNGWTNAPFSTRNAAAALVAGNVQLKGAIGTNGTNAVAFTLPAGLRPEKTVFVPVDLCGAARGSLKVEASGVVTVQGEQFSNAQCFTSLEGVSFNASATLYSVLTPINGWTNAPSGTSNIGLYNNGTYVQLRGAVATTAANNNQSPFTLPSTARPPSSVYVPVGLCNNKRGRLFIQSNGTVTVMAESAWSDAQCMVSLEGVTFAVDTRGFTALSLQNGWLASGGTGTPGVELASGVVRFKGAIVSGTSQPVFTLPAAFRPQTAVYVNVGLCNAHKGRLIIQPTGRVDVQALVTSSDATCFTGLDGASFTLSDFTPATIENGWANAGFGVGRAGFAVNAGVVQLKGAISSGVSGALFTLPVAARPSGTVYLPTNMCGGARGRIIVATNGVVTMVPQTGALADAACFTDLEGLSFPVSTSPFTALPLQNGWLAYGGGTRATFVGNVNGLIRLTGAVKTVATNSNTVPFILPAGFRPSATVYQRIDLCNAKKGRVTISSDGTVSIGAEWVWGDAQCFASFEGVSFPAASTGSAMTLQNGWSNYTSRVVAAANSTGIVRLQGAAFAGSSSTLFTLPDGLRPLKNAYIATDLCNATNGRLFISASSGEVTVETAGGPFTNASCFTSLEGISFSLGN